MAINQKPMKQLGRGRLHFAALMAGLLLGCSSPIAQAVEIACVGDSITFGFGVSPTYPTQLQTLFDARAGAGTYNVGNFGVNSLTLRNDGDRPYTANAIYPASLASTPDYVVIMLGANDAKIGVNWNVAAKDGTSTSIDIYNTDYATLINSYRTLPSSPHIFVCSPIPVRTVGSGTDFGISGAVIDNEMSPALRSTISTPPDVTLIELNANFPHDDVGFYISDKVHPSATGYAFIAEAVYNAIATAIDPTWNDSPLDGATNVDQSVISWTPNSAATDYQVYLGTNQLDLANATPSSPEYQGTTTATSFVPSLSDQTNYFWRIDTVTASATITGSVWSFTTGTLLVPGDSISIDFSQGGAEVHAGGELIGPLMSDSQHWNAAVGATGSLMNLTDGLGTPTGVNIQWASSNMWDNSDGTADDEHKLSVGYLDDTDVSPTVTISNIPYSAYRIYGLFSSDQSAPRGMVNVNVNGEWALGGNAATTASAWGTIGDNFTSHGEYWTEIDPGVVLGNYWTVDTTGSVCTIAAELRNGSNRASLTGVIIEQLQDTDSDGIPDALDPDDDNDDMPDVWEIAHFLNPLLDDSAENPDHDFYDNLAEYVTDTDPQDGQSGQTFSVQVAPGSSDAVISFSTSIARHYTVEFHDDLENGAWQSLDPSFPILGSGLEMMIPDPDAGGETQRFYRLRIEIP